MARRHTLKTIDYCWDAVESGEKTFEIRRNDRGYQRGDIVCLEKIDDRGNYVADPAQGSFSRRKIERKIGFMLIGGQFGIAADHVLFSLEPVNPHQ